MASETWEEAKKEALLLDGDKGGDDWDWYRLLGLDLKGKDDEEKKKVEEKSPKFTARVKRAFEEEWWRVGLMLEEEWEAALKAKSNGGGGDPTAYGISPIGPGGKNLVPPFQRNEVFGNDLAWSNYIGNLVFPVRLLSMVWGEMSARPKEKDVEEYLE